MKKVVLLMLACALLFSCNKEDNSVTPEDAKSYSQKGVGQSAKDIISTSSFQSLVLDIQYMDGYEPEDAAVSDLVSYLGGVCNKPGGIKVTKTLIPGTGGAVLSIDSVRKIEQARRTGYNSGTELHLYVLVLDASYTEPKVLGVAYMNTSVCLFGKTIYSNSGGLTQISRSDLEAVVLEHEVGHMMGLVNIGTPMVVDHADPSNKEHCNNRNCLMYYQVQTTAMLGSMRSILRLDQNCLNDLHANGGK